MRNNNLKNRIHMAILFTCLALMLLSFKGWSVGSARELLKASNAAVSAAAPQEGEVAVINFAELARKAQANPSPKRQTREIHEHPPAPQRQGIPPASTVIEEKVGERKEEPSNQSATEQGLGVSPPLTASFPALDGRFVDVIPPDTNGAVGMNHLMVALNSEVAVQSRDGAIILSVPLEEFWEELGVSITFDPRVLYDKFNDRWILTSAANSRAADSAILLAVSATGDPTGIWYLSKVDADAGDTLWADYPSVGFNKDWIVVQANMFPISSGSIRSHIFIFGKADRYAGRAKSPAMLQDDDGFTQIPATNYDNTSGEVYLVENWDGRAGALRIRIVKEGFGVNYLTAPVFYTTSAQWDDAPPEQNFAPQLGSPRKININDARMQSVVYRNGSLWCAQTVFLSTYGFAVRSSVQWWQIDPGKDVIKQRGRIDDPTGRVFYAFPSLAVNRQNDALIGFSRFSANEYAAAGYAFRATTDPINTFRAEATLKGGEAPYYLPDRRDRNRWGDYSATMCDPVNDLDFWTIQEYATFPFFGRDNWGTWWGRVSPQCAFTFSSDNPFAGPTGSLVSHNGFTFDLKVTTSSECSYQAVSNVDWIRIVSGGSGSGSGIVRYTVLPNPGPERIGSLTIAGQSYSVWQLSRPNCLGQLQIVNYGLGDNNGAIVGSSGFTLMVRVTIADDCAWTAQSNNSWIAVLPSSGKGNGEVKVTVAFNPLGNDRFGSLLIAGVKYSIWQKAAPTPPVCNAELKPVGYGLANGNGAIVGGKGYTLRLSVIVSGNCYWIAKSDDPWITIASGQSGKGDGEVVIVVAPNPGNKDRVGWLTIAGKRYSIWQIPG